MVLAALPLVLLVPARSDALARTAGVQLPPLARFQPGVHLGRLVGVAAHAQTSCGADTGVVCSEVVVPLDRSGVVPGTVTKTSKLSCSQRCMSRPV